MDSYLFVLFGCVLFGGLCGAQLVSGLRRGLINPTGLELLRPPIRREVHPVSFWLSIFLNALGLFGAVGVAIASLQQL